MDPNCCSQSQPLTRMKRVKPHHFPRHFQKKKFTTIVQIHDAKTRLDLVVTGQEAGAFGVILADVVHPDPAPPPLKPSLSVCLCNGAERTGLLSFSPNRLSYDRIEYAPIKCLKSHSVRCLGIKAWKCVINCNFLTTQLWGENALHKQGEMTDVLNWAISLSIKNVNKLVMRLLPSGNNIPSAPGSLCIY